MNNVREKLDYWWEGQTPDVQRNIKLAIVSFIGLFLIVGGVYLSEQTAPAKKPIKVKEESPERTFLEKGDYEEVTSEAVSKQLSDLKKIIKTSDKSFENKVKKLSQQIESSKANDLKLAKAIRNIQQQKPSRKAGSTDKGELNLSILNKLNNIESTLDEKLLDQEDRILEYIDKSTSKKGSKDIFGGDSEFYLDLNPSKKGENKLEIKTFTLAQLKPEAPTEEEKEYLEKEKRKTYIPVGSIIAGVLLSGLDTPTYIGSKEDPRPIIVRVKGEAILPNGFTMDLGDCHLTASGFGSLSEERAHFRSEILSCVHSNGAVMETELNAYAVSAIDGKEGVRGRLVRREGSALAAATITGGISGLANAFSPASAISSSSILNGDPFQTPSVDSVATSTALSGATASLNVLKDHYSKLATEMFPVLEIDSFQEINFVVTAGTELQVE